MPENLDLAHNQSNILATKAKAVAHHVADPFLPSNIRDIVQIAVRIWMFIVDRRRQDPMFQSHDAYDGFNSPCGSNEMTHHAFAAGYRNFLGFIAQECFDGS